MVFSVVTKNKKESLETFKQLTSLTSGSKKINNCSFLCESLLSSIFDKSLNAKCFPHGYIKALFTNKMLSLVDLLFRQMQIIHSYILYFEGIDK